VKYVAADAIIGLYAAHGLDGGLDVSIVSMLMKPSGYCMAVATDNADLQKAAGDVLASLAGNGTIDVIERKWLGTSVALDSLPVIGDSSSSEGGDDGDSSDGDGATADEDASDGTGDEGDTGSGDGTEDTGDDGTSGADGEGDGTSGDEGDGTE
jgi:polar amino acid transport system substrate-binding protein